MEDNKGDNSAISNDFLTRDQLSQLLQVSKAQIHIWEKEGLPVMSLGHKTLRYNLEDVKTWLLNRNK